MFHHCWVVAEVGGLVAVVLFHHHHHPYHPWRQVGVLGRALAQVAELEWELAAGSVLAEEVVATSYQGADSQ
ncbi:hypothetical protein [Kaarinaea lacus]